MIDMKIGIFSSFLFLSLSTFADSLWLANTQNCILNLQKNKYTFGKSQLNCEQKTAESDCSGFVNNIMKKYFPNFYGFVLNEAGQRPNTLHYFSIFSDFKSNSKFYTSIKTVGDLRPGDLIGWKYNEKYLAKKPTPSRGHMMLVLKMPQITSDQRVFKLKVADAALSGHENDLRGKDQSGVGIGTISIQIDQNNKPKAYDWSGKGHWITDNQIFMGRALN